MDNKKTGILTFHRALSYGAMLQSYALQNFLFELGIDNEIIDYKCDYMIDHYQKTFRKNNSSFLKGLAWNLLTAGGIRKERRTRDEFVNNRLVLSKPYTADNIACAADEYSAFITGSDQVWSPTCVGFDPVYFLTFAKPEQKYSYAASIATKEIPENIKSEFAKRISGYEGYSVRENSGAKIVEKLTGNIPEVNIDPTLLLTRDKWDKLAVSPVKEKYIFLFTVLKPKKLIDYALKLGNEKGLKVIYLNKMQSKKYDGLEYMDPVTADKFVGLIKNAEYVCTNSFHGTAFSIIYHKNFVVETETVQGRNIRSEELMQKLGIGSRIMNSENCADINSPIDWSYADKMVNEEREHSKAYLERCFK